MEQKKGNVMELNPLKGNIFKRKQAPSKVYIDIHTSMYDV